ncbi:MAG TPA: formylglycine-generating enzyme family protein [Gemmataceae bacterium]|jgi:formylglycine-generating enzyme required for sulfatase activity
MAVAAFALLNLAAESPPERMKEVWIPAGEFTMGDEGFDEAKPLHNVYVDGFWMDETEVTNEQFAEFVRQTGYVTHAEKPFAGAPPGAGVFDGSKCPPGEACRDCSNWWDYREGACWRCPEGRGSDLRGREKHPAVHIAWEDAAAYARWGGKRLPTEAEWERAARGGLEGKRYYWGDELRPNDKWMANIWQGDFPTENSADDGFKGTAPVKSYPPNAFGLYDMAGNVWEWCADWYRPDYYADSPQKNPQGPDSSIDPDGRGEPKRVQRGGSFLCSDKYCIRYRAGARGQGEPKTGLSHTGFRCVRSAH